MKELGIPSGGVQERYLVWADSVVDRWILMYFLDGSGEIGGYRCEMKSKDSWNFSLSLLFLINIVSTQLSNFSRDFTQDIAKL